MNKKTLSVIIFVLILIVGAVWGWGFIPKKTSAESYLNKSVVYHQQGRYQECVAAARQAIKVRPDYAEAYNNIGSAYNSMNEWDKAIVALEKALVIKPDFQLAKNNLTWAKSQKEKNSP